MCHRFESNLPPFQNAFECLFPLVYVHVSYRVKFKRPYIAFTLKRHNFEGVNGWAKISATKIDIVAINLECIWREAGISSLGSGDVRTASTCPSHSPQLVVSALECLWCGFYRIGSRKGTLVFQGHVDVITWFEDVPQIHEINLGVCVTF